MQKRLKLVPFVSDTLQLAHAANATFLVGSVSRLLAGPLVTVTNGSLCSLFFPSSFGLDAFAFPSFARETILLNAYLNV